MELEQMSTAELQAIAAKIPAEIEKRNKLLVIALVNDANALCVEHGFTLQDLADAIANKPRKPVAAKFRHPDGHEWTGRGRPPRWVVEWNEAGRSLQELEV